MSTSYKVGTFSFPISQFRSLRCHGIFSNDMEQRNGRVRSQTQAACWACLPFARKQNLSAVTALLFCSGIDCKVVWSLGSLTHSLRSWVQIWWKIHLAAHYSCSPQLMESDRVTSKLSFFIVLRVTPGGSCPTFQLPPSMRIRPLAIFPVFHTVGLSPSRVFSLCQEKSPPACLKTPSLKLTFFPLLDS